MSIPVGLCQCGCGKKTRVSDRTARRYGYVKGKPRLFVPGHSTRTKRGILPPGVMVDPQDQWLVEKYAWHIHDKKAQTSYVMAYLAGTDGRCHGVRLHRLIMNAPEGMHVDHINGNTLDNRRCNLRVVSQQENKQNRTRLSKRNIGGFRGVYWIKREQKWEARGSRNGKGCFLGYFSDLLDAAEAAYCWRLANMPGFVPENDPFHAKFVRLQYIRAAALPGRCLDPEAA